MLPISQEERNAIIKNHCDTHKLPLLEEHNVREEKPELGIHGHEESEKWLDKALDDLESHKKMDPSLLE
jgi:hypothetical protein